MKWVLIDGIFLFGLPAMRIPWLEWSSTFMTVLFLLHAAFDAVLMFQVGLPFALIISSFGESIFGERELAISETSVDPSHLLNHASLILGKQIIHILPEGYVQVPRLSCMVCLIDDLVLQF